MLAKGGSDMRIIIPITDTCSACPITQLEYLILWNTSHMVSMRKCEILPIKKAMGLVNFCAVSVEIWQFPYLRYTFISCNYDGLKGLRPALEGVVVTMHEGACETRSQILRLISRGIWPTCRTSSSALWQQTPTDWSYSRLWHDIFNFTSWTLVFSI